MSTRQFPEGFVWGAATASFQIEGASTEEWGRPDRVKASGIANAIARKVTGVDLTDPMSGFFVMRREVFAAARPRLAAVGAARVWIRDRGRDQRHAAGA